MMGHESDLDRIRRKAHELWEADGHPHGRDQDHWEQAREIIAIEDSQASTLLPRNTGVEEPFETRQTAGNYGDLPNLTDQGEHALTDTSREPELTQPPATQPATAATGSKPRKTTAKAAVAAQPDAIAPVLTQPNPAVRATGPASIAARVTKTSGRKTPTTGKTN